MTVENIDPVIQKKLIHAQKAEITEHFIYARMAETIKGEDNRAILKSISGEELKHHNLCNYYTCEDVQPNKLKIWVYYQLSRFFGATFGLKLMERSEKKAHDVYEELVKIIPEASEVIRDEEKHDKELIDMINDERLEYSSEIVRGLNVAVVEMTGALAGFTFALQNIGLVLTSGVIIGITMTLSLASTEYLAAKSSTSLKSPLKSVVYASLGNVFAMIFLLIPYLIFSNIYVSLGIMYLNAVIVIFILTYYLSIVKDTPVITMFLEMAGISLGIAALAFGIGFLARELLSIHV